MHVIGLLGGVASGKSKVGQLFESLGAIRIDADRIGHEALRDSEVQRQLKQRWGELPCGPSGDLDRAEIGRRVFGAGPAARAELKFLEGITHPWIDQRIAESLATAAAQGVAVAVVDAAVMLKAGWDRHCDSLVFVDAPREVRLARALQRGWTADAFAAREASQLALEIKRDRASMFIDNAGRLEETFDQVKAVWRAITDSPLAQEPN